MAIFYPDPGYDFPILFLSVCLTVVTKSHVIAIYKR